MRATTTAEQGPPSERVTAVEPAQLRSSPAACELELDGAPETIGRFLVLRELGSGAMGTVYAAYDQRLDRKVAIKVGRGGGQRRVELDRRLAREAQALARLSHPNVVHLYESGECDAGRFLVMEFLPGVSLREWMSASQRSWREVLAAFVAAGRGLAAAHAEGVIHRDFKPDNVVVGADERVRLVDFGLACSGDDSHLDGSTDALADTFQGASALGLRLTAAGTLLGTPAYMSPEQYGADELDARSDQFSFCAALYEGLYGKRPFVGETSLAIEEEVLSGAIQPPPRDTAVPAGIHRVIVRGLQRRPEDRWSSMEALLAALSGATERPRRRWAAHVAVALSVVGALLATRVSLADSASAGAARSCAGAAAHDEDRPESLARR